MTSSAQFGEVDLPCGESLNSFLNDVRLDPLRGMAKALEVPTDVVEKIEQMSQIRKHPELKDAILRHMLSLNLVEMDNQGTFTLAPTSPASRTTSMAAAAETDVPGDQGPFTLATTSPTSVAAAAETDVPGGSLWDSILPLEQPVHVDAGGFEHGQSVLKSPGDALNNIMLLLLTNGLQSLDSDPQERVVNAALQRMKTYPALRCSPALVAAALDFTRGLGACPDEFRLTSAYLAAACKHDMEDRAVAAKILQFPSKNETVAHCIGLVLGGTLRDRVSSGLSDRVRELLVQLRALEPQNETLQRAERLEAKIRPLRLGSSTWKDMERDRVYLAGVISQFRTDFATMERLYAQLGMQSSMTEIRQLVRFLTDTRTAIAGPMGSRQQDVHDLLVRLKQDYENGDLTDEGRVLARIKVITDKADLPLADVGASSGLLISQDPVVSPARTAALEAEVQQLRAELKTAKLSSRTPPKANAVTVTPDKPLLRTHGLKYLARIHVVKLRRCFFCGSSDHMIGECQATEQACPICLSKDHHGNDCPVLLEPAKNV